MTGHPIPSAPTLHARVVARAGAVADRSLNTAAVLCEVADARHRLPIGGGLAMGDPQSGDWDAAEKATDAYRDAFAAGQGTWRHLIDAAWARTCAEPGWDQQRPALLALCAELVACVEDGDRSQQ